MPEEVFDDRTENTEQDVNKEEPDLEPEISEEPDLSSKTVD